MNKVFVLYYDDENGGTNTIGILSTFEKAERLVKDNFKVSNTFCDSNMVTYETKVGLFVIQEWNVDTADDKALSFYKENLRCDKLLKDISGGQHDGIES